jgi:hypothetical protein
MGGRIPVGWDCPVHARIIARRLTDAHYRTIRTP